MSRRRRSDAGQPLPSDQPRAGPFGTAAVDGGQQMVVMADAARRCRWIAVDINADGFMLFFVSPPGDKRRLSLVFDAEFPAQSPISRLIGLRLADEAAERATRSTVPFWWASSDASRFRDCLASVEWLGGPIAAPVEDAGIAFPVYADRGQAGLVVFHGQQIVLDGTLYETHARCFSLFAAVTRLKPIAAGRGLTVSKRELECLSLAANGLTSEQIAAELGLSVHTANQYLANTAQKLNAVNRMHAVAKALRLGLIE